MNSATLRRLAAILGAGASLAMVSCAGQPAAAPRAQAHDPEDTFQSAVNAPPSATTLFRYARILVAQGRDNECRQILQELTHREPSFAPAWCDLAELHMRAGRVDDAVEVMERGVEAVPRDARLAGNLGVAYMIKGDHERALERLAQAAALGADDARHRANMAAALGLLGRYEESLAEYEKVVAPGTAHYNLGVLARARQDHDRAEQEFKLAIQLDPTADDRVPLAR